jgi:hypothetical protein
MMTLLTTVALARSLAIRLAMALMIRAQNMMAMAHSITGGPMLIVPLLKSALKR